MTTLRMTRTPNNIGTICFYFGVNNKLILFYGLLIYRVVVPIMWAATFSNGGVDEKDVIIMTQMRQINDLEKDVHFNFTFHFNITIQTNTNPNTNRATCTMFR